MNKSDKLQNVVKLLSSLGVNIKTKSRFDIINTLPTTKPLLKNLNNRLKKSETLLVVSDFLYVGDTLSKWNDNVKMSFVPFPLYYFHVIN